MPFVGFDPEIVDLGEQLWGRTIDVPLIFRNDGGDLLTVASVVASCDCTLLPDSITIGTVIPPRGLLDIPVVLQTRTNPGALDRTVTLTSAGGFSTSATIRMNVVGTWTVTPESIDFGRLSPAAGSAQIVTFRSGVEALHSRPRSTVDWIECVEADSSESEARNFRVSIRADAKLGAGIRFGHIVFTTTCSAKPECAVYVRATVVAELTPHPVHVVLSPGSQETVEFRDQSGSRAQLVKIVHCDERTVRASVAEGSLILEGVATTDAVSATAVSVRDSTGKEGDVRVSITPR